MVSPAWKTAYARARGIVRSRLASLSQAIGQKIETENQANDRNGRCKRHDRPYVEDGGTLFDHTSPIWIGRREAKSQEPKNADRYDCIANAEAGIDDQHASAVGQNLDQHDVE